MDIERIKQLKEDGTLDELYRAGYITFKPFLLLEFYRYKEAYKTLKKTDLVFTLSQAFKCSERTVYSYLGELDD